MAMTFSQEEVDAIREQYEELLQKERGRREELEWTLRMELARMRDAELASKATVDTLSRVASAFRTLIPNEESGKLQTVASRPAQPLRATPPPISAAMRAKDSSYLESFNRTRNGSV
jgi:hypothetical protein